jgi:hypothetical protein
MRLSLWFHFDNLYVGRRATKHYSRYSSYGTKEKVSVNIIFPFCFSLFHAFTFPHYFLLRFQFSIFPCFLPTCFLSSFSRLLGCSIFILFILSPSYTYGPSQIESGKAARNKIGLHEQKHTRIHTSFLHTSGIGVLFIAEAREFSLLHSVQTASGAHPASYPKSLEAVSPDARRPGREGDYSLPLVLRLRISGVPTASWHSY